MPGALRWVVGNAVTDTSDFGSGGGDRFPFYKRAETILARLIGENPTDPRINDFRRDLADCHEHTAEAMVANRPECRCPTAVSCGTRDPAAARTGKPSRHGIPGRARPDHVRVWLAPRLGWEAE